MQRETLKKYDNSSIWALFLFFNAYIFYLAPVKIYFDNNFGGDFLKILIIMTVFILAIRNIYSLSNKPFLSLLLFMSFTYLIFDKTNFINVAMPIVIALSLVRVDINRFIYKFYVISNIFWIVYIVLFFIFYELITTYDLYSSFKNEVADYVDRGGLGFVSPNNISFFLCLSAVFAFLVDNRRVSFLYLVASILSFNYTYSRAGLVTTLLIFILILLLSFKKPSIKIVKFLFYLCITLIGLLAVLSFIGVLDNFKTIDLFLSHRLHYISLILTPSIFGSIGVNGLDMSLISLMNKGGFFAFLLYVFVMFKVLKINYKTSFLVLSYLILGLSENIINQYNIMTPLIFLIYFKMLEKKNQEGEL